MSRTNPNLSRSSWKHTPGGQSLGWSRRLQEKRFFSVPHWTDKSWKGIGRFRKHMEKTRHVGFWFLFHVSVCWCRYLEKNRNENSKQRVLLVWENYREQSYQRIDQRSLTRNLTPTWQQLLFVKPNVVWNDVRWILQTWKQCNNKECQGVSW